MSHSDVTRRVHQNETAPSIGQGCSLRIVVASSGLGHVARGIETWAASLGRALHERGECVTLCKGSGEPEAPYERVLRCSRRDRAAAKTWRRVLPRSLTWRLGLASAYGFEQATFAWKLIWFLHRWRADVLHVQDPLVALWAERARRARIHRAKVVLAHGTEEPPSFLAKLAHVQHLAPLHADTCRDEGVWRPGWTMIPNFVDTATFRPGSDEAWRHELGIPADAIVILTVAALKRQHKRLDVLIDAVAKIREKRPDLPVYLVAAGGREPDTEEVIRLANERLGDRARVLVGVRRNRMPALYRSADVFTLASLTEMMPIALLEAGASGLPSVVNDDPVLRWVAGPSACNRDISSADSLAGALAELAESQTRRQRAGVAARRYCVDHFGEAAVVEKILAHYRTLTGKTKPVAFTRETHDQPASRISVIIPAYNSAAWIGEAIESVLEQTAPPHEIIVVDDGSTDGTAAVLQRFAPRIRYFRQENRGVAAARNLGVAMATGELIAFLDADDVWHRRKLEIQSRVLTADPTLDLVGTGTFAWPGHVPYFTEVEEVRPVKWSQLVVRNRFTTSSVLVRRASLLGESQEGPFDEQLRGPEDLDLWLRLAEKGRVGLLDAPLVGYRTLDESLGRRPASMERGLQRILEKLDSRNAWGSRTMLRRKAMSHTTYSCAYMYSAAGRYREAMRRLVASFVLYPLPYHPDEVRMPLARVRMLARVLAAWARNRSVSREVTR